MLLFQVSPPAPALSSLQPQAPPATPCLPSLPAARPTVTLGALSLPTPCPRASAGWPVLCLGTDSNSHGFCGKAHSSLGYPPPCPGRRALGQSPFPLEGWPGWLEEEAGDSVSSVSSAHIPLTVIPQGGGYPESSQSQGARLLVKLQLPALQVPSAVCPGGVPDPIAQPQPEALLPSPSSCDTGLLHSLHFPPSVATLPWVPVIFVLTFPFFFGS